MPREKLPARRPSWTQTVKIDNTRFYLTVGEYPDGRPGEIWIEAHKMGSFTRGVIDSMARMVSLALQCGADITDVVKIWQGMCFPPDGPVTGEVTEVVEVTSIVDWVAQELSNHYLKQVEEQPTILPMVAEGDPLPDEKVAGHISKSVWS
jgi:ribonucleoside-diphosphate reductase alpha chain